MRAGAHGYVLKGADGTETLRAIHAAASGEAIFSPTITERLTEYFATPDRDHVTRSDRAFPNLTEREHEILSLMAEGYTNNAIASRLYLSPKTVRNYVSSTSPNYRYPIDPRQSSTPARPDWEQEEILREVDRGQCFLASRKRVAYTAIKLLRAAGASVHHVSRFGFKSVVYYRTASGG